MTFWTLSKTKAAKGQATEAKAGRSKGSKTKDKARIEWTPEMVRLEAMVCRLLHFMQGHMAVKAGVLDLKAARRGRHYAVVALKYLPQPPVPFLMVRIVECVQQ